MVEFTVTGYDESRDEFAIMIDDGAPHPMWASTISATLLPALTGEYGEPQDFIGRCFEPEMP